MNKKKAIIFHGLGFGDIILEQKEKMGLDIMILGTSFKP